MKPLKNVIKSSIKKKSIDEPSVKSNCVIIKYCVCVLDANACVTMRFIDRTFLSTTTKAIDSRTLLLRKRRQ